MTDKKKSRYIHETTVHELKNPSIIVGEILKHFSPKTVIDLWCWLWSFVKVFQDYWIDAYWVNGERTERDKLFIDDKSLLIYNLEQYHDFWKQYDMALSLEVAEHIDEKYSDNFVKTITSCSDIIIFSAAIPWQTWQNHINLQSPEYRERKFNTYWYNFYDVFRHIFWNNEEIFWWYKQNIFLVAKKWVKIPDSLIEKPPRYIIHPDLFNSQNVRRFPTKKLRRILLWRILYSIFPIKK